jgi:hypothetical protein
VADGASKMLTLTGDGIKADVVEMPVVLFVSEGLRTQRLRAVSCSMCDSFSGLRTA